MSAELTTLAEKCGAERQYPPYPGPQDFRWSFSKEQLAEFVAAATPAPGAPGQEAAAVQAVGAAPVAWRTRYRSEPGMLGHYPWTYTERIRGMRLDQYEYEPLYAALPPSGAGEKTS